MAGFARIPTWLLPALRTRGARLGKTDLWVWLALDHLARDLKWTAAGMQQLFFRSRLDLAELRKSLDRLERLGAIARHFETSGGRILRTHTALMHEGPSPVLFQGIDALAHTRLPDYVLFAMAERMKELAKTNGSAWPQEADRRFVQFPHALFESLWHLGANRATSPAWLYSFLSIREDLHVGEREVCEDSGLARNTVSHSAGILEGTGHLIRLWPGGTAKAIWALYPVPQRGFDTLAELLESEGFEPEDALGLEQKLAARSAAIAAMRRPFEEQDSGRARGRRLPREHGLVAQKPSYLVDQKPSYPMGGLLSHWREENCSTDEREIEPLKGGKLGHKELDTISLKETRETPDKTTKRESRRGFSLALFVRTGQSCAPSDQVSERLLSRLELWQEYWEAERGQGHTPAGRAAALKLHVLQLFETRPASVAVEVIDWAISKRWPHLGWISPYDRLTPEVVETIAAASEVSQQLQAMSMPAPALPDVEAEISAMDPLDLEALRQQIHQELSASSPIFRGLERDGNESAISRRVDAALRGVLAQRHQTGGERRLGA